MSTEDSRTSPLQHDPTSKLPSKHSQPPIAAQASELSKAPSRKMALPEYDTRVRWIKKYRTQLASGPATVVAVLAGVSSMRQYQNISLTPYSLPSRTSKPVCNRESRPLCSSAYSDRLRKPFKNAWECAKYLHRTEGIRGFWAGTTAPLFMLTVTRVVGFSVYQQAKYAIDGVINNTFGYSPLAIVNTPGTFPTLSTTFCFTTAGALSGAATTLFTCKSYPVS